MGPRTDIVLERLIKDNKERQKQLIPTLRSIVLSKDKPGIKKHLKDFIKELKDFGVKQYNDNRYMDSKNIAPIFWSNLGSNNELLKTENIIQKLNIIIMVITN